METRVNREVLKKKGGDKDFTSAICNHSKQRMKTYLLPIANELSPCYSSVEGSELHGLVNGLQICIR